MVHFWSAWNRSVRRTLCRRRHHRVGISCISTRRDLSRRGCMTLCLISCPVRPSRLQPLAITIAGDASCINSCQPHSKSAWLSLSLLARFQSLAPSLLPTKRKHSTLLGRVSCTLCVLTCKCTHVTMTGFPEDTTSAKYSNAADTKIKRNLDPALTDDTGFLCFTLPATSPTFVLIILLCFPSPPFSLVFLR